MYIGKFCSIADNISVFLGGNHRTDLVTSFPFGFVYPEVLGTEKVSGHPSSKGDVVVGNDVWIASGATIFSGVKIADGVVLAANSTITKNVGPYEIWAGNPARLVKKRFPNQVIDLLLELAWWDRPLNKIDFFKHHLTSKPNPRVIRELINILGPKAG